MSSSPSSSLPPPGKRRKVDATQFLDLSAQEAGSDEQTQSDDEDDLTSKSIVVTIVKQANSLCISGDFIAAFDEEEEEEDGPSTLPPNTRDLDQDLHELVLAINKRAAHYNRSVRQMDLEGDWLEEAGNAVVKAVNDATYSGDPANGLWLMRVRVSYIDSALIFTNLSPAKRRSTLCPTHPQVAQQGKGPL